MLFNTGDTALEIISYINLELIQAHGQGDEKKYEVLNELLNGLKLMMMPSSGQLH